METARDAILQERFMHTGETTEQDVWQRVAEAYADNADEEREFFNMMNARLGFPNTPAIANAGRTQQQASACFVLPIEDSLVDGEDSIMETLKNAVAVHKSGGGTGFCFGRLRPKGEIVSTTGRKAPGPVEFLHLFSEAIGRVTQAGLRNGANMGILPVGHRDIMEFISCKRTEGVIHNFNISVALTNDFMENPTPRIWDAMVEGAWRNGEPGAVFIDTVNRTSPHPDIIEATNPCGEVPLLPYEACVLGSINLSEHISLISGVWCMNYDKLRKTVHNMVRLLDNIIDKQHYPLKKIEETHKRYRKIGIGVMGYADALIKLGVVYGSPEAIQQAKNWMRFVQEESYAESKELWFEKGAYEGANKYGTIDALQRAGLPVRRNVAVQVIAPTGTIARLAKCSFGIEPNFAAEYDSFVVGGRFREVHPLRNERAFITTRDVRPIDHIRAQSAFQTYTDQAVSKTVNLPYEATVDDVADIYRNAWELGCKGITVLREDSREDVVIKDCSSGVCQL